MLTIPAGSSSVTVDLTADDETGAALVEATETLTATITAVNDVAPDQDHALTVGAADEAVVTISDTDAATVSVSPATVTISEDGAAAALTFALTDVSDQATLVTFEIPILASGSGLTAADFSLALATGAPAGSSLALDGSSTATKQVWVLTIPAGSSSVTVDLTADDEAGPAASVEATETLTATITAVNDVAPDQDHAFDRRGGGRGGGDDQRYGCGDGERESGDGHDQRRRGGGGVDLRADGRVGPGHAGDV